MVISKFTKEYCHLCSIVIKHLAKHQQNDKNKLSIMTFIKIIIMPYCVIINKFQTKTISTFTYIHLVTKLIF
jgi:hypothetical protein